MSYRAKMILGTVAASACFAGAMFCYVMAALESQDTTVTIYYPCPER